MATLNEEVLKLTSKQKMAELAKFISIYNEFKGASEAEIKNKVKARYGGLLTDERYNQLLLQSKKLTKEKSIPTKEDWEIAKAIWKENAEEKIEEANKRYQAAVAKRRKLVPIKGLGNQQVGDLPTLSAGAQKSLRNAKLGRIGLAAGLGVAVAIGVIVFAPVSVATLPVIIGALGGGALAGWAGSAVGKVFVNNVEAKKESIDSAFDEHREEIEELEREIEEAKEFLAETEDQFDVEIISRAEKEAEEEAKKVAEEEKIKAAEEEAKRKAAEDEAKRKAAEDEAKRKAAEEEEKRKAAEEAKKKKAAEDEAKRKAAEDEAKRKAAEEAKRKAGTPAKTMTADEIVAFAEEAGLPSEKKDKKPETEVSDDKTGKDTPKVVKITEDELKKVDDEVNPKKRELEKKAKESAEVEKLRGKCRSAVIIGATTKVSDAKSEKQNAERSIAKLAELESRIDKVSSVEDAVMLLDEIKTTVKDIKVISVRTNAETRAEKVDLPTDEKGKQKLFDKTVDTYLHHRHKAPKDGLVKLDRMEEEDKKAKVDVNDDNYFKAASELDKLADTSAMLTRIKRSGGLDKINMSEHDVSRTIADNVGRLAASVSEYELEVEIEDDARIEQLLKLDESDLTDEQRAILAKHKARTLESEHEE